MNRRNNRGFTLIEVMVALAILAFAITGLLIARNQAVKQAGWAIEERRMSLLLEQKMAEISLKVEKNTDGSFAEIGLEDYLWEAIIEEQVLEHLDPEDPNTKFEVTLHKVTLAVYRRQDEESKKQLIAYFLKENPEDVDKKDEQQPQKPAKQK